MTKKKRELKNRSSAARIYPELLTDIKKIIATKKTPFKKIAPFVDWYLRPHVQKLKEELQIK